MNAPQEQEVRSRPLEILGTNGDLSQRRTAMGVGVSLGKVNCCLSEMARQGFIKIRRLKASKNKTRYVDVITPRGLKEKARLAAVFLQRKIRECEEAKRPIHELAIEVHDRDPILEPQGEAGISRVQLTTD